MKTDALAAVRVARARVEHARTRLQVAVDAARAGGASWHDIGHTLGISRQAAFKRFGRPVDPRTGETMRTRSSSASALKGRTEWVFEQLAAGAYDDLAAVMAPGVAEQLTRDLVLDAWARAVAEYGALESCVDTRLEFPDGTAIDDDPGRGMVLGQTVLNCEAGSWWGRVAFDADDLIAGILIVPVGATDLPF